MKHTHTIAVLGIVAVLGSTGALFAHASASVASAPKTAFERLQIVHPAKSPERTPTDSLTRIAERLRKRIERRFSRTAAVGSLRSALAVRRAMFARTIDVVFHDEKTGADVSTWQVSLGRYPDWMTFSMNAGPRFDLDASAIDAHLVVSPPDGLTAPSFATVVETRQEGKIVRATVDGTVKDGQTYGNDDVARSIVSAFKSGKNAASVPVRSIRGAVLYDDGVTTHVLHELGVGRSEFASSPWGRKQNVRKAMNEKANGVVIPRDSVFSFNSTLGGPVTYSNGWYDSLIIVNGKDLEPAPGGGICQSATTVFRAAVAAGLPIVTRKSHSLYVHYYKEYGMGLDATVFPGKQDMTFRNDTEGPLVLLGMTDAEDNAYSTIYGIDDDRAVNLEGPFFGYTHKEPVMGRVLKGGEVAWIQHVAKADGTSRDQLLVAQYTGLPKSVALEYEPVMHGAADLVADAR